jgi:phosphoglycolate phosphatase
MRLVIFDFDGTIVNSLEPIVSIINQLAVFYKFEPFTDQALRDLPLKTILKKQNLPFWKQIFVLHHVKKEYRRVLSTIQLQPELTTIIQRLQEQYEVCILSSNSKKNILSFFKQHAIKIQEQHIHVGRQIFRKEKYLSQVLLHYGVLQKEAVYICDEYRDVDACNKIGLPCIFVEWGFNSAKGLKQNIPVAKRPDDIIKIINNMV